MTAIQQSSEVRYSLPNNDWTPRPDQLPLWDAMVSGKKRGVEIAHRRWGKDDIALHWTACAAMQRPGNYWHLLPKFSQCRRAIWDAVNPRTGLRRINEAFPEWMRAHTRNQDMNIEFINGSRWSLLGSDSYDSLVGSPPVGVVFSEFALADPMAWGIISPILAENNGWALFITTPRGKNHAYKMYEDAEDDPHWFREKVTVEDSQAVPDAVLQQDLKEKIALFGPIAGRSLWMQEWMCDFEQNSGGSYFGEQMQVMESEGRITSLPYDSNLPVHVGFDIGVSDAMALTFVQRYGTEIRIIDYHEETGGSIQSAVKLLKEKPYVYAQFEMPHDIKVREWGNQAMSRYETAMSLGLRPIALVERLKSVGEKAHIIRSALPRVVMDRKRCRVLIEHLKNYSKTWNETMQEWIDRPQPNSKEGHGVDSLITHLQGFAPLKKKKSMEQIMRSVNFKGAW